MKDRLISAFEVRLACGGISDMSLWRWLNTPDLEFPQPIVIRRRRYFLEAEIADWIASRLTAAKPSASK